jgi:hypothetical protein
VFFCENGCIAHRLPLMPRRQAAPKLFEYAGVRDSFPLRTA